jgi:hypothetical protein
MGQVVQKASCLWKELSMVRRTWSWIRCGGHGQGAEDTDTDMDTDVDMNTDINMYKDVELAMFC